MDVRDPEARQDLAGGEDADRLPPAHPGARRGAAAAPPPGDVRAPAAARGGGRMTVRAEGALFDLPNEAALVYLYDASVAASLDAIHADRLFGGIGREPTATQQWKLEV